MHNYFEMNRNTVLGLILLFLLCTGCNEEQITNVYTSENPDTFTVSGRVVTLLGKTPIAEAAYTILGTNHTGTCDQDGLFKVAGLSQGVYQVVVSATGFATSRVTISLASPSNKDNINQHREFFLLENSSDLNLTVRGQDTGEVLSGVTVEVISAEFPSFNYYGHEIDLQSLPGAGVTDENGQITLTGLPATKVWVAARAHDADADDEPDFGTLIREFILKPGETTTGHMVMTAYTGESPSLVATNLPSGYTQPPFITPSLYFLFSVPMQTEIGKTVVSLVQNNSPYEDIPMNATWTSPIRLELAPAQPLSNPNMDYDFNLTAYSEDGIPFSIWNRIYWMTGDDPVGGDCEGMFVCARQTTVGNGIGALSIGLHRITHNNKGETSDRTSVIGYG